MPEVYKQDEGDIQADMYAYNMAGALPVLLCCYCRRLLQLLVFACLVFASVPPHNNIISGILCPQSA